MPNEPKADIQVENETAEPYRGVMIFRTLQAGSVVTDEETSKVFPKQTFYAILTKGQRSEGYKGSGILAYHDIEGVRSLIDRAAPGTGVVIDRDAQAAADAETAKAAGR